MLKAGLGTARVADAGAACAGRLLESETLRRAGFAAFEGAFGRYGEMAAAGVEENWRVRGRHWRAFLAAVDCNMMVVMRGYQEIGRAHV